ncbi:MAG: 3-hydroxyacyl-CoA dehydrogenase [Deltaproteobacteria bacterium]|nr:MAG: 3-hydroxyacyl-CoA dehydrogenase [Deltaproteobacteria bacterium]
MNLQNCGALITGAASGLGEACARMIVKNGGSVTLLDLNEERGQALASDLGDKAQFFRVDVTSNDEVQNAIDKHVEAFGGLHAAINCAGIATGFRVVNKDGTPCDLEVFTRTVTVNLVGTFNVCRLAATQMNKNEPNEQGERGVLINTASVAAFEGQIGQSAYSASKGGVAAMTLPLAREFARAGIRVLCIAPGIFDTPMMASMPDKVRDSLAAQIPFPSRFGQPSEYAFLAKHILENTVLNGETIRLDGAIRMGAR